MADIDAPHAGGAVDQAAARAVGDIDALATLDETARLRADRARHRPGLNKMLLGHGLDAAGCVVVQIIIVPLGSHRSLPVSYAVWRKAEFYQQNSARF